LIMPITEAYAGSATIGSTEFSLTNASTTIGAVTAAGFYQIFVDWDALAMGDQYELRVREKCQAGDTQKVLLCFSIAHDQGVDGALNAYPGLMLMNGWDVTIKKLAGTDRTIAWSIRRI